MNDGGVEIIGYQLFPMDLLSGLFLFNHSCKGTFALPVSDFADLYTGPVYKERKTDTEVCPGLCHHKDNLNPCTVRCECAFIREIMQLLKNSAVS